MATPAQSEVFRERLSKDPRIFIMPHHDRRHKRQLGGTVKTVSLEFCSHPLDEGGYGRGRREEVGLSPVTRGVVKDSPSLLQSIFQDS